MDDLMTKIPEWEREAAEYERKAAALRQIIDGIRALNGDASRLLLGSLIHTTEIDPPRTFIRGYGLKVPKGREAVRQIVAEKPGIWKVKDMKAEIIARGWGDPGTGTEAALKRLAAAGEAEKVGHGAYRFDPQPQVEGTTEDGERLC